MFNPESSNISTPEVSESALNILSNWEVSGRDQQELQYLTGSFEYGDCEGKLNRLTENPCYVKQEWRKQYVVVPKYLDYSAQSGQCGDLAMKLYDAIKTKTALPSNIEPAIIRGLYSQFFNQEGYNHFWVSLHNQDTKESVYLDPSFKKISSSNDFDYIPRSNETDSAHSSKRKTEVVFRVMNITTKKDKLEIDLPATIVLGSSETQKYIYGIGFAHIDKSTTISPVISIVGPGGDEDFACISPHDNSLKLTYNYITTQPEILSLLKKASQIQIKKNILTA